MQLLTVSETATKLRISRSLIYRLAELNQLPHLRINSRLLFREEDLERWIEARIVGAQPAEMKQ